MGHKDTQKRVEDLSETLKKEIENIKTNQSEMRNAKTEIENRGIPAWLSS